MQRQRVWTGATLFVVTAAAIGATTASSSKEHSSHAAEMRATPAPAFVSFDRATMSEILAYARSLTFDTSHHAADNRRLPGLRSDADGPRATLAPEIGSATLSDDAVASGRIVGRITVDGPQEALGLAKGENYIWVDKVAGQFRMIVIPTAGTKGPQYLRAVYRRMPFSGFEPSARFMPGGIWVRCGEACCSGDGGGRAPRP
jgi:hypothetical protein